MHVRHQNKSVVIDPWLVLYERLDADHQHLDDRQAYTRSFCNFMAAVRPRYAVPFASYHSDLQRETQRFHGWIVSPIDVMLCFDDYRSKIGLQTEVQVMLPGSSWDDTKGFDAADVGAFVNHAETIGALLELDR